MINIRRLAVSKRPAHIRKHFENIRKAMFQLTMLIQFILYLKSCLKDLDFGLCSA